MARLLRVYSHAWKFDTFRTVQASTWMNDHTCFVNKAPKKMFNASQLYRLDVQPFSCLRGNSFLVSDKSLLQLLQASRFVGVLTITPTATQRYSVPLLLSQRLHTSLNHKRVDTTNQPAATDGVWLCQHLYTTFHPQNNKTPQDQKWKPWLRNKTM